MAGDDAIVLTPRQALLDVLSRLGEDEGRFVLIGGLAPKFILEAAGCPVPDRDLRGTFDVDLAIDMAIKAHSTAISTMLRSLGFYARKDDLGTRQHHSFIKSVRGNTVKLDLLTAAHGGFDVGMCRLGKNLGAIPLEGVDLAFLDPIKAQVGGRLLNGGRASALARICRAVPFIVLKSLALADREEEKDAYDIVTMILRYKKGAISLAADVRPEERNHAAFKKAVCVLQEYFQAEASKGCRLFHGYGAVEAGPKVQPLAVVRDFLMALGLPK